MSDLEYRGADSRFDSAARVARATPSGRRIPPQALEAERATLAAMMLDSHAVAAAVQIVTKDDFYKPAHQLIAKGIFRLFDKNEAVDIVTLSEELRRSGDLEKVGGEVYIAELLDAAVTSAHVEFHAEIVREKSLLRRMIEVTGEIAEGAFNQPEDVAAFVDEAEHKLFEISESGPRQGFVAVKDLLHGTFEKLEKLYNEKKLVTGVPTGFIDLDTATAGFQDSELILIAARPSMGKTAFVLNIAEHMAVENKLPVAFFSLEMSSDSLVQRLLSSMSRVDGNRLRTGFLRESEWPRLTEAAGRLGDSELYIDDTAGITALEVRAKCRRLMKETDDKLACVIIDYLQLLRGHGRQENRQQEIAGISRSLKALAKELKIPVVALSQLKRPSDIKDGIRRPALTDLRESGSLEQDADVCVFIHRPEMFGAQDKEGVAEIIIGKQRNGPIGVQELRFNKSIVRFENYTRVSDEH